MLVRYSNTAGAKIAPAILKRVYNKTYPDGRDASREGTFSVSDELEISLCVPRRIGASGVIMRITPDGGRDADIAFELKSTDGVYDVYSYRFSVGGLCHDDETGLFYYEFLLLRGLETLFTDTSNNVDFTLTDRSAGRFRMLVYSDDFTTPEWFGEKIVYHIFVDRFFRGRGNFSIRDATYMNDDWDNGVPQYADVAGGDVANNVFFGGNLWGVAQKLDYLASLGVGTIYLSPIFDAASNHKYDTGDYTRVDEMFGGDEALDTLIGEAGKRGIRIILDGVFNHVGDDSRYFNKYGHYPELGAYQSAGSEYFRWFSFRDFPNFYECWWNIPIMPRLRHDNPTCRHYFTAPDGICASYIRRGISGWRLDVADELCDDFLDELRKSVKEASPDAVIVGEVWENAADKISYGKRRRYFRGKQLDSVMNYPLRNGIIDFILHGDGDMLYDILTEIYSSYPRCVCDVLLNLLGTHDTERILTVLADAGTDMMSNPELARFRLDSEARERARKMLMAASVIQYTVYGVPSLYYGDEVGVEGGHDPFCRMPFPWGREDKQLLAHYRRLGEIRSRESVYSGGDFRATAHGDGYIVFERTKNRKKIVTVVNSGTRDYIYKTSQNHINLLDNSTTFGNVIVKPMSAAILKVTGENENVR